MSHAFLIVALSPEQLATHSGDVEAAVAEQMEPFDESGEWFADGKRWDYWMIGGQYSGRFWPDYDPMKDPDNIETCQLCDGTGTRKPISGKWFWRPTPGECSGCDGTGRRAKCSLDWKPFKADVMRRDHLGARFPQENLSAFAFLQNRHWCEQARLGLSCVDMPTECDIKSMAQTGEPHVGRCLHQDEETEARIVSFQEDEDRWDRLYWPRFIGPLPSEATLVIVDYHA